jgi:UDP-N-acetylmuramate dehydrogenase
MKHTSYIKPTLFSKFAINHFIPMPEKNFSLLKLNTFGIDVLAARYICLNDVSKLPDAMTYASSLNEGFLVLGEGSNLLFTRNFNGLVIHNCLKGIELLSENDSEVVFRVQAGENWDGLVKTMVEKGFGGLENLSIIPGSVGSAPVQNIGAYGVEVKDSIVHVEGYTLPHLEFRVLQNEECRFSYRNSIFKNELKNHFIITAVVFKLRKHPVFELKYGPVENLFRQKEVQELKSLRETIIEIRRSKLPEPSEFGNAGSFFKNPVLSASIFSKIKIKYNDVPFHATDNDMVKVPAAWFIEQAGWKGVREGNVGTWRLQPLVIVNYGNATGSEVYNFSEKIRVSVVEKFGVELEREVNVI